MPLFLLKNYQHNSYIRVDTITMAMRVTTVVNLIMEAEFITTTRGDTALVYHTKSVLARHFGGVPTARDAQQELLHKTTMSSQRMRIMTIPQIISRLKWTSSLLQCAKELEKKQLDQFRTFYRSLILSDVYFVTVCIQLFAFDQC